MRIVLVDDHTLFRMGVRHVLTNTPGHEVVGEASTARSAFRLIDALAPDIVLMDIAMPGMDGIEATAAVKAKYPEVAVVMLTAFEEAERIVRAIVAGAEGYLVKRADAREVLEEIRAVAAGGSPMTPSVARSVLASIRAGAPVAATAAAEQDRPDLSERESEVLRALVAGKGYKEIAYDLHISIDTVRTHIRRIYRKLRVQSAPAAVARAIRERIV